MPVSVCEVHGVVYDVNGSVAANVPVFVVKAQKSGTVLQYRQKKAVSNSVGSVSFSVPQNSNVWLEGPFFAGGTNFNVQGGVVKAIPDAASATLESLGDAIDLAASNANLLSVAIAAETSNRISADAALSTRIDFVSTLGGGGGSGSVTSQELSATSAALNNAISVVSNSLSVETANRLAANNALSTAISVVSQLLSNEISARVAQDALLSARIDAASNAASVADTHANTVSAAVVTLSAAVSTTASALSARIDSVSNAVSVLSASLSTTASALSARINVVSNALSALILDSVKDVSTPSPLDGNVLMWNSVQAQWVASAIAVGTGSVTSTELSAVSAAAASADNTLSTRIDTVSNAASVISAAVVSVNNRVSGISAAVSSISADLTSTQNRVSANSALLSTIASALSVRIDTVSQAASVADAHANTVSAAVVVVSNLVSTVASALSARIDTVSNALSALVLDSVKNVSAPSPADGNVLMWNSAAAQWIASAVAAGAGSVTSTELSAVSAAAASADNTLSGRIDTNSQAISVLSQAHSVLSAYVRKAIDLEFDGGLASTTSVTIDFANGAAQKFDLSGVPTFSAQGLSAGHRYVIRLSMGTSAAHSANWNSVFVWPGGTPPTLGGSSAVDLLAFYTDGTNLYGSYGQTGGGGGSVTSTELSAVSAAAASADNTLSARIDSNSQLISVISQQLSVLSAGLGTVQMKVVGSDNSVSAAALTKISGLSVSVAAAGVYQLEGYLMHTGSALSVFGFGMSTSAATFKAVTGRWFGNLSVVAAISVALSVTHVQMGFFNETGIGSVNYSALCSVPGTLGTELRALVALSTAGGSLQLKAKSGGSGVITIKAGSFIRAYKIA